MPLTVCFGLFTTTDIHCALLFVVTDKRTNALLLTIALLNFAAITTVCVVQECHVHHECKQAYLIIDLQILVYVLYSIYTVLLLILYSMVILVYLFSLHISTLFVLAVCCC